jgi:hypothetical protein
VSAGGFPGLVARTGVAWRWVGYDVIATRRGDVVRVECFEAPCRACDQPFTVHTRLPSAIRSAYALRRCSNRVMCAIATNGTKKHGIKANGRRCMSAVLTEDVNPGHE